jgi:heme/copper-type cytochrome/quinol oxidase subunit 2
MQKNTPRNRLVGVHLRALAFAASLLSALSLAAQGQQSPRIVEILADHDSRYKMQGRSTPSITVTAGEKIRLRVTAIRAKNENKDGSIHGFSLLRPKDHKPVPGWELLFKPGTQEFDLTAPEEPGEYQVVCTVICSENHEGMTMKFFVEPKASQESEVRK